MKTRVSAVQYALQDIRSFAEFEEQVTHYMKTAMEFSADFVLFPEFFTTQLLSIPDEHGNPRTIEDLPDFTDSYKELFLRLSADYHVHIIAGTHVVRKEGKLYNTAHYFGPDGTIHEQAKLHVTPTEKVEWNMSEGDGLEVFDTPKGRMAMLTCYDIEFPEIVRMAKAKGADVIFCPSCTDDRQGFFRVRYCCHARAIENQVYIVTTGTVGALRKVDFMRANFGQAAVITPNDIPFPPAGIQIEGVINDDMIVTADLDLELLYEVRERGSVTTWRDRRTDLYTDWN
ncbi:carbon-nitrogen hydrolase family protein [Paenibacillus gansuensis]|uniref:Carbon-nitrogen hydrolase family protein n=1 Tax=Paenibacillus gansuensis TaxID=306542 RepID=A0ABW5PA70_9BACL